MSIYYSNFIKIGFVVILLCFANNAQTSSPDAVENKEVNDRVKQLESQVRAMQAELEELKRSFIKKAETETVAVNIEPAKTTKISEKIPVSSSETKQNSDKKDLSIDVGNYKITPYGIIFFNAFANSSGTNNSDDPLWATPGKSNFSASGRQTRFGVKIEGGRIGSAAVSGVVEADFYGGFPAVGVGENMGVLRLRVAKAQFDWERTSLTVGQDWVIFAPNNPTSLAAAAIPQFAAAGNLWSRLPQVLLQQKLGKNFKWQAAILAPGTGDFPTAGTPALLQPGSGAASNVPFFQSRISYSEANWFRTKKNGTIGFAAHYGRSDVQVGNSSHDIDSVGIALDWNFPIVKRVTLTGEAFFGRNLGGFQGGIFQGYNTDFAFRQNNTSVAGGVRGIGTRGGWTQIGWVLPTAKDRLSAFASIGIDDPRNEDLRSVSNRNFRSRNLGFAFDLIYKFSPQFSLGGEFRRLETNYIFGAKENANHVNLAAAYSF